MADEDAGDLVDRTGISLSCAMVRATVEYALGR
jgi:hypothetical protein